MKRFVQLIVMIFLWITFTGAAQDNTTCPIIVQTALETVGNLCSETGRNQACYGNLRLTAEPQLDIDNLEFDTPGDIAEVIDIKSLKLNGLDETVQEWGISLMRVQANLPDTLPGQNVTLLLFGDVEITPAQEEDTPEGFSVMQAFYLKTGTNDAPCLEAPDSGLLLQTPEGNGDIEFSVNEVNIRLGSTAYLQAQPGEVLTINVVEGEAVVTAFEESQIVAAGARIEVPIDENLAASGPPSEPEPYVVEDLQALPIRLLEREIEIAVPLTATSNFCTITASGSVNLRSGPGTNFPRQGSLSAGESAQPDGQASSSDGQTWWHLSDGRWVRADVVVATRACDGLSIITDLPPTPTPGAVTTTSSSSSGGGGGSVFIPMTYCALSLGGAWPNPVSSNITVGLNWGDGNANNVSSILAGGAAFTLSIDGVNQGAPGRIASETYTSGGCPIGVGAMWSISALPPGTHQLVGITIVQTTLPDVWNCNTGGAETSTYNPGDSQGPFVCTITVQ